MKEPVYAGRPDEVSSTLTVVVYFFCPSSAGSRRTHLCLSSSRETGHTEDLVRRLSGTHTCVDTRHECKDTYTDTSHTNPQPPPWTLKESLRISHPEMPWTFVQVTQGLQKTSKITPGGLWIPHPGRLFQRPLSLWVGYDIDLVRTPLGTQKDHYKTFLF